jgi:hypothetical protein
MLSVALFAPTLVGLNFTDIVHDPLATTVVHPFTSSTKFDGSLTVTPLTVRGELPVLLSITDLLIASSLRDTNPKFSDWTESSSNRLLNANVAVTLRTSLIATVQVPVSVHAPLQPVNVESFAATAVSVTLVPIV